MLRNRENERGRWKRKMAVKIAVLCSISTENLTDADIGSPILDVTLEAGDLLYFPRGTIHQVMIITTRFLANTYFTYTYVLCLNPCVPCR